MKKLLIIFLLIACVGFAGDPFTLTTSVGSIPDGGIPSIKLGDIDYLTFDTTVASPAYQAGRLFWDDDSKSLTLYGETEGTALQIGQETLIFAKNTSGVDIPDGAAVYIASTTTGIWPNVRLARADAVSTADVVALATEEILDGQFGYCTLTGMVRGIDTSGYAADDSLYVSTTTAGELTNVVPASGYIVRVGHALNSAVDGMITVDIKVFGCLAEARFAGVVKIEDEVYASKSVTITEKVKAAWAEIAGNIYASGTATIDGDANFTNNVIVATTTPAFFRGLFVDGAMASAKALDTPGTQEYVLLDYQPIGGYGRLMVSDGAGAWGKYLSMMPFGGNVLIATTTDDTVNKLQVAGSLKLTGITAPTPVAGAIYFSSADAHFYGYNGSAWVQLDN